MTDENELWSKASAAVKTALVAVDAGMTWQSVDEVGGSVRGMQAQCSNFIILCASSVFDGKRCYEAVVTFIKPEFCLVRLPEDTAKHVWDKAVSSFN